MYPVLFSVVCTANHLVINQLQEKTASITQIPLIGIARNGSFMLKEEIRTPHSATVCASDLPSYSSADLSSMIAAWVDQSSCREYEKELEISAGMNF